MTTVPISWMSTSIDSLTLPVFKISQSECPDTTIQYIDISSIDNTNYRISDHKEYLVKEAPSRARQIIRGGDILFSTVRPYLKNIAQVTDQYDGEIASTGFSVLRPALGVEPKYLYFYCTYREFINSLCEDQYGVSYPAVKDDQVRAKFIRLPPENEQHRIVAKIEELFSELDKGVESLKTARQQLKVYRQALLKHAFEGKLTEQWRQDNADKLETADQLLERIKQEREARYQQQMDEWEAAVERWEIGGKEGKKPTKPKIPKNLERPSSVELKGHEHIPESWCLAKIGDVASVGTGVTPLKSRRDYYDNGDVAWVTSGALNKTFVSEASGYVTKLALAETNLRLYPERTLLMAMYGEGKTRGKCSELQIPATTNQAIAAMIQCGTEEDTRSYLKWFLMKNYSDIRMKSSGGVQPNINLGIVENTVFPLCSICEMVEIVNELESKLSVVEEAQRTIANQLLKAEALRQSILKKAFSGQLVPQDPADEPASALLARIAKEKEEAAAKTKLVRSTKKKHNARQPADKPAPFKQPIKGISTTDLHAGILALAHRKYEHSEKALQNFGHVKGEKIAHLVEAHIGIDLARNPVKDAAGPNDYPHLMKVESRARKAGFFDVQRRGNRYALNEGGQFAALVDKTQKALGNHLSKVTQLLELMAPLNTRQSEIVTTLYAAWNNLLLEGNAVDDEAIVTAAREDWHKDKLKIDRKKFFNGLDWMRDNCLIPSGKGATVVAKKGTRK